MDGLILLEEARTAGLTVHADGGRLVIRGPRWAEGLARRLIANKAPILEALAADPLHAPVNDPDDLPPDWRLVWEERAAIMEYDGELPQKHAEAEALADILEQMQRANEG